MGIAFTKMSGSGNDFVIIDNREPVISDGQKREFVRKVCAQKTSVGADGVIFIENSEGSDFKWDFYNSDGSSAEMCGNGGGCVARYAYEHKIAPRTMTFETTVGIIAAVVDGANVRVKLTSPQDLRNLPCLSNIIIGCSPLLKAYTLSLESTPTAATSLNFQPSGRLPQPSITS